MQLHARRNGGLVELAVSRHVAQTRGVGGIGVGALPEIDRVVCPVAVHVAVVNVRRPRADMLGVPVRIQLARIGHRHVTEQKYPLHIRGIGIVVGLDQILHTDDRIAATNVMAKDRPAITHEVLLQTIQLAGQLRGVGPLHDQHHLAAVVDQRHVDAALDVTVAVVTAGVLDHSVLVRRADCDAAIHKTRRTARQRRAPGPGSRPGRLPINRVTAGRAAAVLRPTQHDLRRRGLNRGADLNRIVPRGIQRLNG